MATPKKIIPPIPSTPEELAALSAPAATPAPAVSFAMQGPQGELLPAAALPKPAPGPATTVPAAFQGAQGELLTGMPPKASTGAPTQIPLEMRGAQGELLTGIPKAAASKKEVAMTAPVAAATPAKETPDLSSFLSRFAGQKTPAAPEGRKGKGEFWKKLGTVAKNTGRTVAEILQAAMFGWGGVDQPLQYQIRQAGEREAAAKEGDRAFAERMAQIDREWQAAQYRIRDENDLERERMRLEAQAKQAAADRQSSEKIAGLRAGGEGAIPGEDPVHAWRRKTFGGGK